MRHPPKPEREETMAKFTWEHVHLRSPDPEATAQWYHDKLGADVNGWASRLAVFSDEYPS